MIKKVVIECVALVCAVTGLGLEAVADYPANAYIRRGLVVQFDAIDNVGTGTHDTSAAKWKDLVTANAGDYDIPITEHGSWNGTALVTDGRGAGALGGKSPPATVQTMEGCYTFESAQPTVSGVIYSSGLDDGTKLTYQMTLLTTQRGLIFGGNVPMFAIGDDYSGTHSACWIGESKRGFYDGVEVAGAGNHDGFAASETSRLGKQSVGALVSESKNLIPVKMHAIRFYDRQLTADEIAFNSNIDKVRFAGTDPATLSWPTGYRYREGSGIEYIVSVTNNVARGKVTFDGGEEDIGAFCGVWTAIGTERTVTLQATANPGYRFVRWICSDDILTKEQQVSADLTVTADHALLLEPAYTLDLSANAYQQCGLTMQFDGIDNVGTGTHDPSATVWKDLVAANAGAYDMNVTEHGSWNANALVSDGKRSAATSMQSPPDTLRTMEGCYTLDVPPSWNSALYSSGLHAVIGDAPSNDKIIWQIVIGEGGSWFLFGGRCDCFDVGADYLGTHSVCWIKEDNAGFRDGVGLTVKGFNEGYNALAARVGKQTVGAMGVSNDGTCQPSAAKMHAVRHYSRKLSVAEVAVNANIDKIRFGDADPATLTWPEGYRYQDGAGIEYALAVSTDVGAHGGFTVNGEDGGESYMGWFLVDADEITITAVPEPGYRFVGWEGEGLSDAERRQKTISGVSLGRLNIKPTFAFGSADLYVDKGLVVQYDGINNVDAGGHDLSAAKWKDLVVANAGKYDIPITEHGSWNGAALVTDGLGAGALGGKSPPATVQTMEGCYTFESAQPTVSGVIYSSGLDDGTKLTYQMTLLTTQRGLIFGGNVPMFAIGDDYSGTHSACWIGESKRGFYDGVEVAGSGNHDGFSASVKARLGKQSVGALVNESGNPIPVKMHAIRFYDRKLTADEIAFNSNVDQVRFKDADPAALAWPAEISYNSELERLEVEVTATYDERKGTLSVNGVAVPSGVATTVPYGNGTGVIAFVPSLKGYWLESVDIDEPEKVVAQDQVATVRLFDVRSFTAKIRGGGLILIVQ